MEAAARRPIVDLVSSSGHEQRIAGRQSTVSGIDEFLGIPYGIVHARWRHAELQTSLPQDEFDASQHGPRCPQPLGPNNTATYQSHLDFPVEVAESELDCLNLCVTRPSNQGRPNKRFPVFVWIHGGGYGFGSASDPMWNPTRLVAQSIRIGKPIIVVLINYRLNIFGFAAASIIIANQLESSRRGCNFGLGDQRIALEWVSKYIEFFGGDPQKITIGGQSAGGSSAHAHLLEARLPESKPLFRRVTVQSGAVGTLGPIPLEVAEQNFAQLSQQAGLGHLSPDEQLAALSKLEAKDLLRYSASLGWEVFPLVNDAITIRAGEEAGEWAVHLGARAPFQPPGTLDSEEVISILIGDADSEASIWYSQVQEIKRYSHIKKVFEACLQTSAAEEGLQLYGLTEARSVAEVRDAVTQLLTDLAFGYPVHLARKHCSVNTRGSAQNLRHVTRHDYRLQCGNPWPGIHHGVAQHCIDLIYLFDCFYKDMEDADKAALECHELGHVQLVEAIQRVWIDFVFDDDPIKLPEGHALVVKEDRTIVTEDMGCHRDWVRRRSRFDWISRNEPQVHGLTRRLMEMPGTSD